MCPDPVCMNLHNFQSLINSKWCGKVKKVEIWMDGDGPEWFSGPNILEILQHSHSNLLNFDHQRFLCSEQVTFRHI